MDSEQRIQELFPMKICIVKMRIFLYTYFWYDMEDEIEKSC